MDPTHDPNFQPPSSNPPVEPTAPSNLIPNCTPIQPYVLDEDTESFLDSPRMSRVNSEETEEGNNINNNLMSDPVSDASDAATRISLPTTRKERSDRRKEESLRHKIPKKATELDPSSSSSSECGDAVSDTALSENGAVVDELCQIDKNHVSTISSSSTAEPMIHSFQIADLEEVPHGIPRQATNLHDYKFPTHRLKTRLSDPDKYPLVIVACGSFSPITYLHLRMFEMALDAIRDQTKFEVVGGYYSPVSDNYNKPGLAPSVHRVRMCELACERTSSWLMVDAWESLQPKYSRTAMVLDHLNKEINIKRGGVFKAGSTTDKVGVKIMLLAGGDLIESMGEPNVWADRDLHHILGNYGCLIVERTGSDVRSFLLSHDIMYEHRKNILVIKQLIYNDISSTKVRLFIRRHMSVRYLLPNSVIRYIQEHHLYVNDKEPVKLVLNK